MILPETKSKTIYIPRPMGTHSSKGIYSDNNNQIPPIDTNESHLLHQKRIRSEQLIKNFTELLQSSTSSDIEKIKQSLESQLDVQKPNQPNSDLLYCYQCFSIEFIGKMITCSNEKCKKKFCCNCFKKYHVNYLEKIDFTLTNGNWICFECMINQQKSLKGNNGTIPIAIDLEESKEEKKVKVSEIASMQEEERLNIKTICEDYYLSKSQGNKYFKKKCRYCRSQTFHINELLHFASIQNFVEYIAYLFKYQKSFIVYDKEAIRKNKEDIKQYIRMESNHNKEWKFNFAKALCKGCLLFLLNKRNSINIIKEVLKDPDEVNYYYNNNINTNNISLLNTISTPNLTSEALQSQNTHSFFLDSISEMAEPLSRIPLEKQPSHNEKPFLSNHISQWGKEVADFNKAINSLNASILRSLEKLVKGAKLFNDLYKKTPISRKNFEEYFKKILSINNSNKEKAKMIIDTLSNHRKSFFSIIDYGNTFISTNKATKDVECINFQLNIMLSQFEDEFNRYGNIVLGFVQTLNTLQALTMDYIDNLKQQSVIIDNEAHSSLSSLA